MNLDIYRQLVLNEIKGEYFSRYIMIGYLIKEKFSEYIPNESQSTPDRAEMNFAQFVQDI